MNNTNLADPKEGFLRGNLFNNLYDPYKNYKYKILNPTNKKEELLFNILMYKFALKELNLYLDNYPNNNQMLNEDIINPKNIDSIDCQFILLAIQNKREAEEVRQFLLRKNIKKEKIIWISPRYINI